MLLMSTLSWILIGVGVVILVVFIGMKIKDRYYQKGGGAQGLQLESFNVGHLLVHTLQAVGLDKLRYFVGDKNAEI